MNTDPGTETAPPFSLAPLSLLPTCTSYNMYIHCTLNIHDYCNPVGSPAPLSLLPTYIHVHVMYSIYTITVTVEFATADSTVATFCVCSVNRHK